jgi:hypothetical protein
MEKKFTVLIKIVIDIDHGIVIRLLWAMPEKGLGRTGCHKQLSTDGIADKETREVKMALEKTSYKFPWTPQAFFLGSFL